MPVAEQVVALHGYNATQENVLSFESGDIITIMDKFEGSEEWWLGELDGQTGFLPCNHVQSIGVSIQSNNVSSI